MGRAGGGGGGRAGGGHSGGGGMRSGGGHSSSGFNLSGSSSGRAKGSSFSGGRAGGGNSAGGFGMGNSGGSGKNPGNAGRSGDGRNRPGGPGGMGAPQGITPPPGGRQRRMFFGFTPFWRRGYGGGYYRGAGGGCLTFLIIIILVVFLLVYSGMRQFRLDNGTDTVSSGTDVSVSSDDSASSGSSDEEHSSGEHSSDEADRSDEYSGSTREKIESDLAFDSDCILDELGWFDDVSSAGESLEDFFDATGVQPYIYLRSYDSSLTSDSKKEDYAQQWYEDNIGNEQTFLYIYFAEEDTDNDVGYMYCVCGYDIEGVMDEEARELFWDYVDEYWPTDLSTDEMFAAIFNTLADEIM